MIPGLWREQLTRLFILFLLYSCSLQPQSRPLRHPPSDSNLVDNVCTLCEIGDTSICIVDTFRSIFVVYFPSHHAQNRTVGQSRSISCKRLVEEILSILYGLLVPENWRNMYMEREKIRPEFFCLKCLLMRLTTYLSRSRWSWQHAHRRWR